MEILKSKNKLEIRRKWLAAAYSLFITYPFIQHECHGTGKSSNGQTGKNYS